jgi:2-polyprenyl-3-methyl-5-hydroxy-6-metoxy-1,4-benzoquinol methylase
MHDTTTQPYVLGHSEAELRRLAMQSAFWGELTEEVLRRAGIGAGMHVLDIGSGAGDVAILAARLVGPSGSVLGIDRSEDAVKRASQRAAAESLSWCRFSVADVQAFDTDQRFDAVVGRLVLMYVGDPARTLRALVRHLKPDGIVAFQEIVLNSVRSVPPLSLVGRVAHWVVTAFERAGAEVDMGLKLDATFRAAGLQPPECYAAARPVAGADSAGYAVFAAVVRALLPAIDKFGIATAAEVDIDTLAHRLRDETVAANACWLSPVLVGAWARIGA